MEYYVSQQHIEQLDVLLPVWSSIPCEVLEVPGVKVFPGVEGWQAVSVSRTAASAACVGSWLEKFGVDAERFVAAPSLYSDIPMVGPPRRTLYPHQRTAVQVALARGGLLLADEPGLGKTTTALVAAETMRQSVLTWDGRSRPVLIVGPKSVRDVWLTEALETGLLDSAEQFLPLSGFHGDPARLGRPVSGVRYIYAHYEIVAKWWQWISLNQPVAVIVDEAHLAKNPKSQRGKAAEMVVRGAPMRLLLTGTPILNRAEELHHMLSMLTGAWSWGTKTQFMQRYCGAQPDGYGWVSTVPTNTEELRDRLAPVYIRRTLPETGIQLPPLTRRKVPVDLDAKSANAYAATLSGYSYSDVLDALRGRRAGDETISWVTKLRKIAAKGKIPATVDLATSLVEQDLDVIVFTWMKSTAEEIARKVGKTSGKNAIVIHGGIPSEERSQLLADFYAKKSGPTVLVATYGALSVGVTLTRAHHVIMHDLDYVPATMIQAEKRAHRLSQTKATTSYWMIGEGTIDAMIAEIVTKKAATIASSLGDDEPMSLAETLGELSEADREMSLMQALEWALGGSR